MMVMGTATSLCVFSLLLSIYDVRSVSVNVTFRLKESDVIRHVPKQFLSVALGSSLIRRKFAYIDWTKLITLSGALSPAYCRVGGNDADFLIFQNERLRCRPDQVDITGDRYTVSPNPECFFNESDNDDGDDFVMNAGDWDRLNWFIKWSNLSLIFDLNSLSRNANNSWRWSDDIAELFRYSSVQLFPMDFELGNEPNLYANETVPPEQLALDYGVLNNLLQKNYPFYNKSIVIGPSVTNLLHPKAYDYLEKFLVAGGGNYVDALTFHHYYFDGRTATADNFMDPQIMDDLQENILRGRSLIRKFMPEKPDLPLWLGETSNAYGGGAPGLSDRYVASFIWIDKLGQSALHGLDVVIRQSLYHNSYALVDDDTNPRPDYWISLLHKRLVGQKVIRLNMSIAPAEANDSVRFYAHCDKERVTVFGMNLLNETVTIAFNSMEGPLLQYLVTAPNNDLLSSSILLNGLPLTFNGTVPKTVGVQVRQPTILPSQSIVFYELGKMIVPGCT